MMATPNSQARRRLGRAAAGGLSGLLLAASVVWSGSIVSAGNDPAAATAGLAARAKKAYLAARERVHQESESNEAAWQFGRACFDWAEFAESEARRESIANEGIAACRQLIARTPAHAAGHYYLGMNLGQLARTKLIGALKIVEEMEQQFKTARDLDKKFDYAGPDRNLGLLYFEAPGWPASIGDRKKARQHLELAVTLSPEYPENRLCLLEACVKWGDRIEAQRAFKALEKMLPQARQQFAGEEWEGSWLDWERRRQKLKEKLEERSELRKHAQSGRVI